MNPMYTSSLHDYRTAYPFTDEFPTLSQTGWLGYAMARIEAKKALKARRAAQRQRMWAALRRVTQRFLEMFSHPRQTAAGHLQPAAA